VFVEPIVSITKLVVATTKSIQYVQPILELIQMENPQFFRFQLFPVSSHSIKILKQMNMFLKQVGQIATTYLGTLQELSNLRIEFEQVKENMSETYNHLANL
jgi:hypothetical protein